MIVTIAKVSLRYGVFAVCAIEEFHTSIAAFGVAANQGIPMLQAFRNFKVSSLWKQMDGVSDIVMQRIEHQQEK